MYQLFKVNIIYLWLIIIRQRYMIFYFIKRNFKGNEHVLGDRGYGKLC